MAEKPAKKVVSKSASKKAADGETTVLAKYAAMPEADRLLGEKLHAIVKNAVPELTARLWYSMPAYAKDGKVICFFQCASQFKTRYGTLGFLHDARLDDGPMWPVAFALIEINATVEKEIVRLVKLAAG
ncbi:MAG: DUF1801 domain-containing protein [Gemmataceae bacterium]